MAFGEDGGRRPGRPRAPPQSCVLRAARPHLQAARPVLKGQGPLRIFILKPSPRPSAAVHSGLVGSRESSREWMTPQDAAKPRPSSPFPGCGMRDGLWPQRGPADRSGGSCRWPFMWRLCRGTDGGKGPPCQPGRVGTFKVEESKEQFSC